MIRKTKMRIIQKRIGRSENKQIQPKKSRKISLTATVLFKFEFYLYNVLFTAFTMRSTFGKASSIKVGENANGVSVCVTRMTGASK